MANATYSNIKGFRSGSYIKGYAFNVVLFLICFYGICQLFSDTGIFTLYKLHQTIKQQEMANSLLEERQKYLENRVSRLEAGDNFDYDYLDEVIRRKLGVIKEDEKVIFIEN